MTLGRTDVSHAVNHIVKDGIHRIDTHFHATQPRDKVSVVLRSLPEHRDARTENRIFHLPTSKGSVEVTSTVNQYADV
jgi:hypothetical protein